MPPSPHGEAAQSRDRAPRRDAQSARDREPSFRAVAGGREGSGDAADPRGPAPPSGDRSQGADVRLPEVVLGVSPRLRHERLLLRLHPAGRDLAGVPRTAGRGRTGRTAGRVRRRAALVLADGGQPEPLLPEQVRQRRGHAAGGGTCARGCGGHGAGPGFRRAVLRLLPPPGHGLGRGPFAGLHAGDPGHDVADHGAGEERSDPRRRPPDDRRHPRLGRLPRRHGRGAEHPGVQLRRQPDAPLRHRLPLRSRAGGTAAQPDRPAQAADGPLLGAARAGRAPAAALAHLRRALQHQPCRAAGAARHAERVPAHAQQLHARRLGPRLAEQDPAPSSSMVRSTASCSG